jgi:hypothetical protein
MEVAGARRPGVQCEEARRAHGAGAGARHVGTGNAHRGGAGEDRGGGGRGDSTRLVEAVDLLDVVGAGRGRR